MKNALKGIAAVMLVVIQIAITKAALGLVFTNFFSNAPLYSQALVVVFPILTGAFFFLLIKKMLQKPASRGKSFLTIAAIICTLPYLESCSRAQANVQTLYTNDCGQTWKLIKAGDAIPKALTACEYSVTIPDYPMQGESRFKASFKDRVLADIEISYDYIITDGMAFISEAKYLGKAGADAQDASNAAAAYETAENSVIDKRIKEIARNLLPTEDIVDFSQSDFEDQLLKEVNKLLESRGVKLNFLSFVPQPSEQTAQAIDVATAYKIYESKGLQDVGKSVMSERAGATKIEVKNIQPKTENE
jgi:hypothetical protein